MGTMLRRIPGTASWTVFRDGAKSGSVYQGSDGSWYAQTDLPFSPPTQAPTRKEAARQLTGGI